MIISFLMSDLMFNTSFSSFNMFIMGVTSIKVIVMYSFIKSFSTMLMMMYFFYNITIMGIISTWITIFINYMNISSSSTSSFTMRYFYNCFIILLSSMLNICVSFCKLFFIFSNS